MNRRDFITLLGGAAAACPLAARAQQAEKKYAVGILSAGGENTALSAAFSGALRELGWVEGRNVVFEYRYAENRPERLTSSDCPRWRKSWCDFIPA
jgi:putative ABC transport system substrate-binding protein